jgi:hypothetical protein
LSRGLLSGGRFSKAVLDDVECPQGLPDRSWFTNFANFGISNGFTEDRKKLNEQANFELGQVTFDFGKGFSLGQVEGWFKF